ncbi:3'-5' exonuclease [Nocardia salmonicida]|uniref:3'-5' exonuclease n=1 Tax=Nocardia salmonicida TaxID=53431 RepID=UPI003CE84C87
MFDLLTLLQDDAPSPTAVEQVPGAVDTRIRTAYVDRHHRAVLFQVDPDRGETTYIYMGTWPTAESVKFAEQAALRINPLSGVLEGIIGRSAVEEGKPTGTGQPSRPVLAVSGVSAANLAERLGIDRDVAERACLITDRDEFVRFAEQVSTTIGWQGDALLDLMVGADPDRIRESYQLRSATFEPGADEDRRIIAALAHPASKMRFTYAENSAELQRVIETGDIAAWRTFLHPEQRRYAEQDFRGSFRLSGGSGTGKSVILVHRAWNLAQRSAESRILLTTFNSVLAGLLRRNLETLVPGIVVAGRLGEPGIHVASVDSLAAEVVGDAGLLKVASMNVFGHSRFRADRPRLKGTDVWRRTVAHVSHNLPAHLTNESFLESEYVNVVLARRLRKFDDYAQVDRRGRGVRLSRTAKKDLWRIFAEHREFSKNLGRYTFPEVAAVATQLLLCEAEARIPAVADHILVDEGQDLHAVHWRFLRTLADEGSNDLFIAEDPHQRIYSENVTLAHHNVAIKGRSRRLTLNYRTTAQNLDFALRFLGGATFHDLEGMVEVGAGYRSSRLGPEPELIAGSGSDFVLDRIASIVENWLSRSTPAMSIAILTRRHASGKHICSYLRSRRIAVDVVAETPGSKPQVSVLTMHGAKGHEFTHVILVGVDPESPGVLTPTSGPAHPGAADERQRELALLYVAATRARDQFVMIWDREEADRLA